MILNKIKKEMKQPRTFLMVLLLWVGCYSTQCQNASHTESVSKNPTSKIDTPMKKLHPLTKEEQHVILHKGTERPFTGEYTDHFEKGTYICKQCHAPLYTSDSKFHSGCGWPSFDDEIKGAVKKTLDADGQRTEITCANCGGHLGHVFYGEGLTDKDTRHCVNSTSMLFIEGKGKTEIEGKGKTETAKAIFAGGCFWGVEYYAKGVLSTQVGYTGGFTEHPTYKEVCAHKTGHIEALEVTYDPKQTTYEELAKLFFEIHDPTQANGQGNDIGPQYLSVVFYLDDSQKATAEKLIGLLKIKGYNVATLLKKATVFWPAEDYHQQYYEKGGGTPYCHSRVSRF